VGASDLSRSTPWRPAGVVVALVTPFTEDERLDEERLASHVRYLVDAGLNGLIPTGGSGEYANLTPDERRRVVELTIEAAEGRVPVAVGALGLSTWEAVAVAEHAAEAGADAVMLLPPYYIATSTAGILHHFTTVAERSGLPIIAYNNPPRTARTIDVKILSELADLDAVVAVKDCDRDFNSITAKIRATRGRITYMCGDDDLVYPSLALGADGAVMAMPNLAPKLSLALYEAWTSGDTRRGLELHEIFVRLVNVRKIPNHPGPLKEMMALAGRPVGPGRRPLMPMSPAEREVVLAAMDELGAYVE
jgi:4-hydroxy-tetrahydrodipicolinate synthase